VEVRDERDEVIFASAAQFTGEREIESQIVRVAPNASPLGKLRVTVGTANREKENHALVSFSGNWVVTNFDDLLALLVYFGEDSRLATMRDASPEARLDLWRDFFKATDPIQTTPENEALDAYFARLAIANQQFRDEGIPGWRTDRGEVFVVLGMPDEVYNATATQQGRYLHWTYHGLRVRLTFEDPTGFGRYRLTPDSRGEFERVRMRVERPRQ
jgi:GWxTD domain-containing protein